MRTHRPSWSPWLTGGGPGWRYHGSSPLGATGSGGMTRVADAARSHCPGSLRGSVPTPPWLRRRRLRLVAMVAVTPRGVNSAANEGPPDEHGRGEAAGDHDPDDPGPPGEGHDGSDGRRRSGEDERQG